jgi:hypothetical protein
MKNSSVKNEKVKIFIEYVRSELKKIKGKLVLSINAFPKSKKTDGEFCETTMTIKCAVEHSSFYWVGVLAHEFGHFLQAKNKQKMWLNFQKTASSISNIEEIFIKNSKIKKSLRKKLVRCIIPMELDADKKALRFIKKFNLPVNKTEYSSTSNLVLYKYCFWAETGHWPDFINKSKGINLKPLEFKISKLKNSGHYFNISNIPRKIFYIFENSREKST